MSKGKMKLPSPTECSVKEQEPMSLEEQHDLNMAAHRNIYPSKSTPHEATLVASPYLHQLHHTVSHLATKRSSMDHVIQQQAPSAKSKTVPLFPNANAYHFQGYPLLHPPLRVGNA